MGGSLSRRWMLVIFVRLRTRTRAAREAGAGRVGRKIGCAKMDGLRHCENAAKPLQMRVESGSRGGKTLKLNNLFFEERSHQVIENKASRPKTKPNEAGVDSRLRGNDVRGSGRDSSPRRKPSGLEMARKVDATPRPSRPSRDTLSPRERADDRVLHRIAAWFLTEVGASVTMNELGDILCR
jgi:hypothetical protein